MDGYLAWLTARLEAFGQPVDLVGHDWGGIHTFNVAMNRPDLIRSWVCDVVGIFHPDYEWHHLAQTAGTRRTLGGRSPISPSSSLCSP